MPRLHLFTESNPGVEVRISSQIDPISLQKGDADIAIRVGRLPGRSYNRNQPRISLVMSDDWDGIHADMLFDDVLAPVCSSQLIAATPGLREPRDLLRYPLLHTASRRHAWPDWLRAHGVKLGARPPQSPAFGHFFMSLEAARQGRGVAIIPEVLLASYESKDELARPLPQRISSAGEYYLLVQDSKLRDPVVEAFRSWILSEAEACRRVLVSQAAHA
jgi:LysR family glycine cleavage system transcriptional activator